MRQKNSLSALPLTVVFILSFSSLAASKDSPLLPEINTEEVTTTAEQATNPSHETVNTVFLQVIDSYLEAHSGPGRGYPVLYTFEQGDEIAIHRRRGNWYFVTSSRGTEGWIQQEKLARTIAPSGLPAALPEINHGDFLAQQGRVGFNVGRQGDLNLANVMAGFRLLSFLGVEAELGQSFGTRLDGLSYGGNLLFEPIKSWQITPFLTGGLGKQHWQEKEKSSVGKKISYSSDYSFVGAGINYYVGFNFVVRAEYRKVSLRGNNGSSRSTSWRLGFSSFF